MGPIAGLGVGGSHATNNLSARSTQSAQTGGANRLGGQSGIRSGSVGPNSGVNKLMSALSDFMRTMDGTSQNDKTLQMLIALMILMALLSGQSGNAQSSGVSLDGLSGGSGQAQLFGQSSSTTISIEQSTTTFAMGAGSGYSGSNNDPAIRGASLDLSA